MTLLHFGKDVEQLELSDLAASGEARRAALWKNSLADTFTTQPRSLAPTYPKNYFQVLFIIAKHANSKHPPASERTNTMWQIDTAVYYSPVTENTLLRYSDVSKSHKHPMRCSQKERKPQEEGR